MEPIEFDRARSSLLSEDDPLRVRFERWRRFLQRELTFSHSESVCHTTEHVERVLLFALLLGRELEVSSDDLDALALCAVFHDTRRHDDDLDVWDTETAPQPTTGNTRPRTVGMSTIESSASSPATTVMTGFRKRNSAKKAPTTKHCFSTASSRTPTRSTVSASDRKP